MYNIKIIRSDEVYRQLINMEKEKNTLKKIYLESLN